MNKLYRALSSAALLFAAAACNFVPPTPTVNTPPAATQPPAASGTEQSGLPQSEAGVPRVSVEDAKAAVERGEAVIVDVRSPGAYELTHVAGALFVPLGAIETDPAGVALDKDRWIITYCT